MSVSASSMSTSRKRGNFWLLDLADGVFGGYSITDMVTKDPGVLASGLRRESGPSHGWFQATPEMVIEYARLFVNRRLMLCNPIPHQADITITARVSESGEGGLSSGPISR